jgi:hypothetical protein
MSTTNPTKPAALGGAVKAPLFLLCALVIFALGAAPALAETRGPGWYITGRTYPTNIPPGGSGYIDLQVFNVGAADSDGTVTVTDALPAGLEATDAGDLVRTFGLTVGIPQTIEQRLWHCTGATVVTCTSDPSNLPHVAGGAGGADYTNGPNFVPQIAIAVRALPGAHEHETNQVTIAGGGALTSASTAQPITISASPPPFGFADWDVWFSNADGTLDTQAGSHPYAATFSFDLNDVLEPLRAKEAARGYKTPGGEVRNIEVKLPPGFVGDPTAVPQCTLQEFEQSSANQQGCPGDTQVGFIDAMITKGAPVRLKVFNIVPPPGVAARFGFTLDGIGQFLDSGVRSGSDYGITTTAENTPQRGVLGAVLTLWGVPADPSHDRWRTTEYGGCEKRGEGGSEEEGGVGCPSPPGEQRPFLTLPTSCAAPGAFSIRANTWEDEAFTEPRTIESHDANGVPTPFTGCEQLGFSPAITIAPDTSEADTPAGLTVEVKPPVGGLEDPEGLSTADIQNTTVTLPEGLVINPGQAAGLQACQASQDGLTTEAERAAGEEDNGPPACPNASKVGTVSIKTPLLEGSAEKELQGNVYVLQSNPPNLELLVAAAADGVDLKLVGHVHLDEATGRLTATFSGTPELPFTDFKLSFSGGAQAALATPTQCGVYTTTSDFDPWSSPFVTDVFPSASFAITSGPGGSPCPSSPLPFSPSLTAGATTDQAGGFTDFSMLLQTTDAQQRISKLQFKVPEGLSGIIAKVPLCPEAQANAGTCSPASQIGHTTVASGPGPYPLVVPQPGQPPAAIYLTGPYQGAPFGLSIVVPVVVGPFVLETQVVRARIDVDPHTAAITVTTNPLPQVIDGVPTDLRSIDAVIDREGFMFNPTNCNPQSFSGTATSAQGAQAAIGSHFQVGSCQSLKFAPKFTVSTPGKTSKADGAGLTAKLSYPAGSMGTQSNITRVKVDLPRQLPSRLTTLQKACTNTQFEADPAGCPAASKIGIATVTTPLLPVALVGPAIFVSHGGEAFPSLTMVLQGYGVTVDLVGTTFISKAGITSTTFKTVPDVPFNTFTLTLPQGKYSALAANVPTKDDYSLCGQKLAMPAEFLAQNGLKINESTPVTVTGCARAKSLTRAQKLSKSLKACRRKAKARRAGCETKVRKQYGAVKKSKR